MPQAFGDHILVAKSKTSELYKLLTMCIATRPIDSRTPTQNLLVFSSRSAQDSRALLPGCLLDFRKIHMQNKAATSHQKTCVLMLKLRLCDAGNRYSHLDPPPSDLIHMLHVKKIIVPRSQTNESESGASVSREERAAMLSNGYCLANQDRSLITSCGK